MARTAVGRFGRFGTFFAALFHTARGCRVAYPAVFAANFRVIFAERATAPVGHAQEGFEIAAFIGAALRRGGAGGSAGRMVTGPRGAKFTGVGAFVVFFALSADGAVWIGHTLEQVPTDLPGLAAIGAQFFAVVTALFARVIGPAGSRRADAVRAQVVGPTGSVFGTSVALRGRHHKLG